MLLKIQILMAIQETVPLPPPPPSWSQLISLLLSIHKSVHNPKQTYSSFTLATCMWLIVLGLFFEYVLWLFGRRAKIMAGQAVAVAFCLKWELCILSLHTCQMWQVTQHIVWKWTTSDVWYRVWTNHVVCIPTTSIQRQANGVNVSS